MRGDAMQCRAPFLCYSVYNRRRVEYLARVDDAGPVYPGGKVSQYETCPREWEKTSDQKSEGKGRELIKAVKEWRYIAYQKVVSYVHEQARMPSSGGDAYRERLQGSISYIDRWRCRCLKGLYELTEVYN